MNSENTTIVELKGEINLQAVEDTVIRVRAAMRNGRTHVILNMNPDCVILSAEFLSFLAATRDHLQAEGGTLKIRGAKGQNKDLLTIAQLTDLIESEYKNPGSTL